MQSTPNVIPGPVSSDTTKWGQKAYYFVFVIVQYGDSAGNTVEENSSIFSLNPNVLVVIIKGRQAIKLFSNKILQFLIGDAD